MNWPLDEDWVCPICGERAGLTWGFIHGECRCNNCHAEFMMRDHDNNILTTPMSLVKEEYAEPAKFAWKNWHIPLDMLDNTDWEAAFEQDGTYTPMPIEDSDCASWDDDPGYW